MNIPYEESIESASNTILSASYVIALVGAGLSAESGIPTFRGKGGLWMKNGEPGPNQYKTFLKDPKSWWINNINEKFDPERTKFRKAIDNSKPNKGHRALSKMEFVGILKHQITQNVDGLHYIAGSRNVTEIHGSRHQMRCIDCETRIPRQNIEMLLEKHPSSEKIKLLPPTCNECGGIIKPDTVMFGESIPNSVLEECMNQASKSDCILVIGTSATVYPAASIPQKIKNNGGKIIELNPSTTSLSKMADIIIRGQTSHTIPGLTQKLGLQ